EPRSYVLLSGNVRVTVRLEAAPHCGDLMGRVPVRRRSEICNRQSSGTQQRCAISLSIALADCTWLLDIGDRRMRIGDVQKAASDFLCKATRLGEGLEWKNRTLHFFTQTA